MQLNNIEDTRQVTIEIFVNHDNKQGEHKCVHNILFKNVNDSHIYIYIGTIKRG